MKEDMFDILVVHIHGFLFKSEGAKREGERGPHRCVQRGGHGVQPPPGYHSATVTLVLLSRQGFHHSRGILAP